MLRAQSVKMGQKYDSSESKEHIWPFIKSFNLEPTLIQLKVGILVAPAADASD